MWQILCGRKCGEAVETAKHVIFDCPALCRREARIWKFSRRREDRYEHSPMHHTVRKEPGMGLCLNPVWCSAITKEATNLQIEKDSHSPAQYRVIGALSNLKEFSQEFNCKTGSKMNPGKKCEGTENREQATENTALRTENRRQRKLIRETENRALRTVNRALRTVNKPLRTQH
nr:unnamed protein product [Callosobruchus chinensis]